MYEVLKPECYHFKNLMKYQLIFYMNYFNLYSNIFHLFLWFSDSNTENWESVFQKNITNCLLKSKQSNQDTNEFYKLVLKVSKMILHITR